MVALFALVSTASATGVRGNTTLKLDPNTAGALTSLGVAVAPVAPATAGTSGISFPITGATGSLHPLAGTINHSGGLTFSKGATVVPLTDYSIVIGSNPRLIASVGAARVAILKLNLSQARIGASWNGLTISNVKATLTAEAAGALNGAFATTAFTAGLPIGVAAVNLRLF
ncbi:MAG: hypothetical protein JHC87_05055 [Thermoleophilaceae bacterium]|nr:hypothetical protein [Thermoleophilaceae bacterium]